MRNFLAIGLLVYSTFSAFTVQRICGQETGKPSETKDTAHQENTPLPPRKKPLFKTRHGTQSFPKTTQRFARKKTGRKTAANAPAIDKNGTLYFAFPDGKITAIDSGGNTLWSLQLAEGAKTGLTTNASDTLYFSSGKILYAIGFNGILKWTFSADNTIDLPSVPDSRGNIYVATNTDYFLYAVKPDGNLLWKVNVNGHIATPPSITANGCIYVSTRNNMLYAINPDGSLRWRRELLRGDRETPFPAAKASGSAPLSVQEPEARPADIQGKPSLRAFHISQEKLEEVSESDRDADKSAITSFTVSPREGTVPLTVRFDDTSTGRIIKREWDFGDGTPLNSEQYPLHTYTAPGNYDVRLMIKRPGGISSVVKRGFITARGAANPKDEEMSANIQEKGRDARPAANE